MNSKFLQESKKRLELEKKLIEDELRSFNVEIAPDVFEFNPPEFEGSQEKDKEADEDEEAGTLLALKAQLEERLDDIIAALRKIEKGSYGRCEKCGKKIEKELLLADPAAKYCKKCLALEK